MVRFLLTSRILPGRAVLKEQPDLEVAALNLVYTSGPRRDDSGAGKHTLALEPRLFPQRLWRAALDKLYLEGALGGRALAHGQLGCTAQQAGGAGPGQPCSKAAQGQASQRWQLFHSH